MEFKKVSAPKEQELTRRKDELGKYYRQQTAGHTFDPLTAQELQEKAVLEARRDELIEELGPLMLDGGERVASGGLRRFFKQRAALFRISQETAKQTLKDNELMRQTEEYAAYEETVCEALGCHNCRYGRR